MFFGLSGDDSFFKQQNYVDDSVEFRQTVFTSVVLSASLLMLSQLLLLLFPSNKSKPTDGHVSVAYGIAILLSTLIIFCIGMGLNLVTMVPHMRCLGALRGIGCVSTAVTH